MTQASLFESTDAHGQPFAAQPKSPRRGDVDLAAVSEQLAAATPRLVAAADLALRTPNRSTRDALAGLIDEAAELVLFGRARFSAEARERPRGPWPGSGNVHHVRDIVWAQCHGLALATDHARAALRAVASGLRD